MTTAIIAGLAALAVGLAGFAPRHLLAAFPLLAVFANATRLGIPLDDLAMILLYVVFLFRVFPAAGLRLSRGQAMAFHATVVFAAFLLVTGLLHVLVFGSGTFGTFFRETVVISLRVLLPFVVARLIDEDTVRRVCIGAAVALGLVLVAHVTAVAVTGMPGYMRAITHVPAVRTLIEGTLLGQTIFLNSNDFSRFVCLSLILIGLGAHLWPDRVRGFGLWGAASFGVILISAASRSGALVCAGIVAAVYTLRGRPMRLAGAGLACVVGIAIVANATGSFERIERRFSVEALAGDTRNVLYREGLRIVSDNPVLGVGPGRFQEVLARSAWFDPATVRSSHNNFLFLGTQYGVFSAFLYLGFLCAFGFCLLPEARFGDDRRRTYSAYGLIALSALFLFGMIATAITTNFFFFILGVTLWGASARVPQRPTDRAA